MQSAEGLEDRLALRQIKIIFEPILSCRSVSSFDAWSCITMFNIQVAIFGTIQLSRHTDRSRIDGDLPYRKKLIYEQLSSLLIFVDVNRAK